MVRGVGWLALAAYSFCSVCALRPAVLEFVRQRDLLRGGGGEQVKFEGGHALFTTAFGEAAVLCPERKVGPLIADWLDANEGLVGATRLARSATTALQTPALALRRAALRRAALRRGSSGEDVKGADAGLKGELYYAAWEALCEADSLFEPLSEFVGVTAGLAMCRAAVTATDPAAARRFERALVAHFHALPVDTAWQLVSREALQAPHFSEQGLSAFQPTNRTLVVAFAGLGVSGLARFQWSGALTRLKGDFDVLFVADPADSWYTGGTAAAWRGDEKIRRILRRARQTYGAVALLGDSMGGSAALRFARHADATLALAPQTTRIFSDPHVGRRDLTEHRCLTRIEVPLRNSVISACKRGSRVTVHYAAGFPVRPSPCFLIHEKQVDCVHALSLAESVSTMLLVAHDLEDHDLAYYLKSNGQLLHLLKKLIDDARDVATARGSRRRRKNTRSRHPGVAP